MSHSSCDMLSTVFYGSTFSEFLQVARYTLRINDFIPRASCFVFNNGGLCPLFVSII